jgi:hypothetical protein
MEPEEARVGVQLLQLEDFISIPAARLRVEARLIVVGDEDPARFGRQRGVLPGLLHGGAVAALASVERLARALQLQRRDQVAPLRGEEAEPAVHLLVARTERKLFGELIGAVAFGHGLQPIAQHVAEHASEELALQADLGRAGEGAAVELADPAANNLAPGGGVGRQRVGREVFAHEARMEEPGHRGFIPPAPPKCLEGTGLIAGKDL